MTQEERWQQQYEQMMEFMETNHRRPSKYRLEEHDIPKSELQKGLFQKIDWRSLISFLKSPKSIKERISINIRQCHEQ